MLNKRWESKEDIPVSILEHIKELRTRIIIVLSVWILLSAIAFYYSEWIFNSFVGKFVRVQFIYLTPAALFMTYIKLAMTIALFATIPLLLYEIWKFVNPGLHLKEKKVFIKALIFGSALFYLGCYFAFQVIIPFSIAFFEGFSGEQIQAQYEIGQFFSYVFSSMAISGVVFELPLFMSLLAIIGIVKADLLKKNRKYVIFIIFIAAAILTPPDVFSQMLIAFPLWGLFELGLIGMKLIERAKVKKRE